MQSSTIKSFVDFVKQSDVFDLLVNQVIFRGQAIQGNLLPGVARKDPSADSSAIELEMLESLKSMGASYLPNVLETDLDLLVRAQHFGLKTRLLDWTSNSLAALWFACANSAKGDVFVYALEVDNLSLPRSVYTLSPFNSAKTRAFQPRLNNPRVIAQHGWFTLHRYSGRAKRFVPLEENPDTSKHLHEYRIPEKYRAELLVSLDRHGVSARTLFPDMGGLCQYLNWKQPAV
jgi:hypothetical protein